MLMHIGHDKGTLALVGRDDADLGGEDAAFEEFCNDFFAIGRLYI